jgi:hypothetical protein
MKTRILAASILVALASFGASAQTTADTVQRDVNQQTRIENGLKDGSLNTKEASRLESEQSKIDRLQAKELRNGKLSPQERAQLQRAQNRASKDIKAAETNGVKGNPESKSSERMQADVQRNINQEKRVEQGVKSGELTNRETGKLEAGQARVDHAEAAAGKDGHVGKNEQARIQRKEDRQSGAIYKKKHNAIERKD